MEQGSRPEIQKIDAATIETTMAAVVDSSLSAAGTTLSSITSEYKHLDELTKLMTMKLRDIHQKLMNDGDAWFDKRSELLDNLQPFYKEVESLHDNSEALLKMMKKIDAYTKVLESRVDNLF